MTRKNLIEAFVEATRTVNALKAAEQDEGKTLERSAAITRAKAEQMDIYTQLRGGDLGKARRILAGLEEAK
jgi:hypothetical protein